MPAPAKPILEVVNLVATSDLGTRVPLDKVQSTIPNTRYDPEMYHALIYRKEGTPGSVLVNASGKVVFAGMKSMQNCESAREALAADLAFLGVKALANGIEVRNLVVKTNFGRPIKLAALDLTPWFEMEYEPEQFPGMMLRMRDGPGTALLFASGACVITGLTAVGEAERFAESVANALRAAGIDI